MSVLVGIVYSILAILFAAASALLLLTEPLARPLVAYLFVLVFALGSWVCVRSARDSFRRSNQRQPRPSST